MMMADTPTFEWLFSRAATADIDWDSVYRAELPRVLNYFRYRIGQTATAEDLTSTTFEKAWRARGRYRRDRASVGTWLLSIARNVAIDYYRARRVDIPLDDLPEPPQPTTLDEELQRARNRRRLSALIATLPERERELLALKYGAEETNRAIARLTGLSESNVGTILSRTVAALRSRWEAGGLP
jgi:RNA polymerase sigma-70 factor (ECF subfamily)